MDMLDNDMINKGLSDDALISQFLSEQLPEPENDGFKDRVMQSLPANNRVASRIWTVVCSVLGAALIVALAVRGDLFGWFHLPTLQQVLAFFITAYTRLTIIHFNPLLVIGAAFAIILAIVMNIVGLVSDTRHFNEDFRYHELQQLRG